MGQVIRFPRAKKRPGRKVEDFFVERLPQSQQHCDLGSINFTCATCSNVSHFSFKGVVFKDLNFYCGSCGVGYKLDNPLFSSKRDTKTK
jgi:hypothetical protein